MARSPSIPPSGSTGGKKTSGTATSKEENGSRGKIPLLLRKEITLEEWDSFLTGGTIRLRNGITLTKQSGNLVGLTYPNQNRINIAIPTWRHKKRTLIRKELGDILTLAVVHPQKFINQAKRDGTFTDGTGCTFWKGTENG